MNDLCKQVQKGFFLLILITNFSFNGLSQINIKDLYEKMPEQGRFSNLLDLRAYQQIKPEESVGYFLLGEIYEAYMRDTDPIKYFYYVETNYLQQKVHYQMAKAKMDKKQARQYRDYFGEVELISGKKKAELKDIANEIDNRLAHAEVYFGYANSLYQNYIECINKYNQCLFDFREIVDLNPNYKDLYLLLNAEEIEKIKGIEQNFKQALENFELYKKACTKIPDKVTIPEYILKPIITYRLQGLVESDFTQPVVELWDFGTWAHEFLRIKNNEIDSIRLVLNESDKRLDTQIDHLRKEEIYAEEFELYKPDQVFQNMMAKYDYASISNQLLEYRENKVDFLANTRLPINNPLDSNQVFFINRLRYYNQLADKLDSLNKVVEQLKNNTHIDAVKKYHSFFEERYGGINRFTRWCEVEKYKNEQIFNENLNHFNQFIDKEEQPTDSRNLKLCYKKDSVTLEFNDFTDSTFVRDTIFPVQCHKINHKWNLITMENVDADSIRSAVIGRYSASGETVWFKQPRVTLNKKEKYHHMITNINVSSDSTTTALYHFYHSVDSIQSCQNYVVHYNWKGNIAHQYLIDTTGFPRYFNYDDLNEEYFLMTKGHIEENCCDSLEAVHIIQLDSVGGTKWEKQMELQGEITGAILTNSNYIVFSNFKSRGFNDQLQTTGATSIAADYIDHEGNTKWSKSFQGEIPLRFDRLYKVNSNTINGFGISNNEPSFLYVLMNMDGEVEFSNKQLIISK